MAIGILGAIGRAISSVTPSVIKTAKDVVNKKNQQPIIQQPMFDVNGFMNNLNQQNTQYMQQMQNYYNQQMQQFQQQMQSQEQQQLQLNQANQLKEQQANAYKQQNQQSVIGANQGILGNYSGYQSTQPKQGAHIKLNSNGQPGAISRYLAKDIWANK